jgi:hypothetical protein
MGKYLDILRRTETCDISDISDKTHTDACIGKSARNSQYTFGRFGRFCRTFQKLERRCPEHIGVADWQRAVEDGRRFLAQWGEQAEALGWSARDLFGLATIPDKPAPNYRRLSRYDETGLIWLLQGRQVVALTTDTAAVEKPSGAVTVYWRHDKPALGPVGDTLDDLGPPTGGSAQ